MTSQHPVSHVFQQTRTIFIHIQNIFSTNILTKKKSPTPGGHVFQATSTIFKLVQYVTWTNLLTKFHDDRTINVASRVLTRKKPCPIGGHFHEDRTINVASRVKNAPALGSHVFQANETILEVIQDIIETNLLTKFHEDWTINPYIAPHPGGHGFKATETIFELVQDFIGTNLLTKFNEDRKINVASRVLIRKNAPPPGGHVFQPTRVFF
ncbi:hypothetical protein DPMN_032494 [Dreissena polymorpha]|uniref:Uncharacterized protein n=1 Tax=Dreissena polymorpha TaxID=45954 RepID=A0A9D4M4A4_DREPO|nr:hypothetical protein DPMN_032494 [Dreissena polymorpha]